MTLRTYAVCLPLWLLLVGCASKPEERIVGNWESKIPAARSGTPSPVAILVLKRNRTFRLKAVVDGQGTWTLSGRSLILNFKTVDDRAPRDLKAPYNVLGRAVDFSLLSTPQSFRLSMDNQSLTTSGVFSFISPPFRKGRGF